MTIKTPQIFFFSYLILFIICAINPYSREIWFAENLPILLLVGGIFWIHLHHRFSTTSYAFMAVLVIMHTIGGHYTFALVPFDFVTDFFGFERNHYDRIAHFSVGFYAYPIAEILLKKKLVNAHWLLTLFPVFCIISIAGLYEVVEWLFAVWADPEAGHALLGSQGDEWDAQKDILADTLGALFAITVFWLLNINSIKKLKQG